MGQSLFTSAFFDSKKVTMFRQGGTFCNEVTTRLVFRGAPASFPLSFAVQVAAMLDCERPDRNEVRGALRKQNYYLLSLYHKLPKI